MHKVRVGILRGGPSSEYDVSLQTGATILKHIPEDLYTPQDIYISREGVWHKNGIAISPHNALAHIDVVWNALHGQYGEDGKVQHILELHKIPYTGSNSFSSMLGMNKILSKEIFKKEKIKTPHYKSITTQPEAESMREIFRSFSVPFIVKPVSAGSSVGVTLVKDFASFEMALAKAFEHSPSVLIEEYISGREATVGIIDGYRDHVHYALPPIEIRPHAENIIPGNFTLAKKRELEDLARRVHQVLGLRHYSRTDFIVSPNRGIFVLEVNTLPGMTESSLMLKALDFVGAPMSHFLDHVLQLALQKK